jgi:hypothetical protein
MLAGRRAVCTALAVVAGVLVFSPFASARTDVGARSAYSCAATYLPPDCVVTFTITRLPIDSAHPTANAPWLGGSVGWKITHSGMDNCSVANPQLQIVSGPNVGAVIHESESGGETDLSYQGTSQAILSDTPIQVA